MIALLIKASVLTTVFALGLNATVGEVTYLARRPRLLARSFAAMYVLTPLATVALLLAIPAPRPVEVAVLLMAISAGMPALPKRLLELGGNRSYVYGLSVAMALLAIVTVPASVALLAAAFGRDVAVAPRQVALALTTVFLAPLGAGLLVRRLAPAAADVVAAPLMRIAPTLLIVLALLVAATNIRGMLSIGMSGVAIVVLATVTALAIGHLSGGPDPRDRTTLAIACASRFPGLGLLIASLNLPDARPIPIVIAYLLISSLALVPYVRWRRRVMAAALAVVAGALMMASPAAAQGVAANPYRPNTADEDWTFLKNTPKTDWWDPIKYIPLGPTDWSLTLSGEIRFRPEGFRTRETAARPGTIDSYLLQRYLFGSDFRFGTRARVFAEVQSGIINGQLRSPRPSDRNQLDLHQAFFQFRQPVRAKDEVRVIVGRQELEIGSTRLISASPGLNVKRSFDGGSVAYRAPAWTIVGAVAKLTDLQPGAFDDRASSDQLFWGVAAGRLTSLPRFGATNLAVYYLGIDHDLTTFAQGAGPESRHTIGGSWSGRGRLDVNHDLIFQWGTFAGAPIRAWAYAAETGYRFAARRWQPRIGGRFDVASGDKDPAQPSLQSFNPLFPGNSYSGAVGLLGPTNLTDLTPSVTVVPRTGLVLGFEAPSYWRTSTRDGVYATDLRVLIGPKVGTGKYVGTNPAVVATWQATRHLQVTGVVTRFLSGGFLAQTFVAEGFGFYSVTARYRF